ELVTNCDQCRKASSQTLPSVRVYRARHCDAVERAEQRTVWGAHAPRVLPMAPSPSRIFPVDSRFCISHAVLILLFGDAPLSTREARVLPRMIAWTIYLTFGGRSEERRVGKALRL